MFVGNEEESCQGKGMFAGVGRYANQKHFCKGIDCRLSYKNIGENNSLSGFVFLVSEFASQTCC